MLTCGLFGAFEAFTKMRFGDPEYQSFFDKVVAFYPERNTMGENVRISKM